MAYNEMEFQLWKQYFDDRVIRYVAITTLAIIVVFVTRTFLRVAMHTLCTPWRVCMS